jgi:hypothetical protein
MISARTKAAPAAKRRGAQLGGDRGSRPTNKQRAIAIAVRQDDLAPVVKKLQAVGCTTLRAIAAALDECGIPAAQGGQWSPTQVMRLLEYVGPFADAAAAAANAAA